MFLDQSTLVAGRHEGIQTLMDLLIGETLLSSSQQRHVSDQKLLASLMPDRLVDHSGINSAVISDWPGPSSASWMLLSPLLEPDT